MTKEVLQQALVVLRGCLDNPDAEDAIAALEAALAQPVQPAPQAVQEPVWMPIDTAPDDGAKYLAYSLADGVFVENRPKNHYAGDWCFNAARNQWRGACHSDSKEATHWMPLPTAPQQEKTE